MESRSGGQGVAQYFLVALPAYVVVVSIDSGACVYLSLGGLSPIGIPPLTAYS